MVVIMSINDTVGIVLLRLSGSPPKYSKRCDTPYLLPYPLPTEQ